MKNNNAIVVEDFSLIADAWIEILNSVGFSNVVKHKSAEGVIDSIDQINPSICLIDINIKGDKNGIELTTEILEKHPEMKVIILTIHDESFFVKSALNAGAMGFVTKNSPLTELKKAIEIVLNGERYLCQEVTKLNAHYLIQDASGFLYPEH